MTRGGILTNANETTGPAVACNGDGGAGGIRPFDLNSFELYNSSRTSLYWQWRPAAYVDT